MPVILPFGILKEVDPGVLKEYSIPLTEIVRRVHNPVTGNFVYI